jgi:hypothetical protein
MPLSKPSRLLVALPLVALAAYGEMGAAPAATTTSICTATADTVKAGQTNTTVNVRYTEEVGDTLTATVAAGSKLAVNGVRKGATPMTAELLVNSEQAAVGDWNVTLSGKGGSCTGTLTVVAPKN